MAIQMRRGALADYDKTKMVPGEWGISVDEDTNDQKAFIAFAPGVDKEVMFVDDAEEQIAIATAEAIDEATEEAEAWAHGDGFSLNEYKSGDGSTSAFQLTHAPTTVLGVYVDGASTSAYTISGKTITFSSAPASGQDNIRINYSVDTSQDNAKYYKDLASQSASSASSSASTATTKANEAAASASAASTSAFSAGQFATASEGSAINADTSAQAAAQSAQDAAASAAMLDAEKILGDFASYEATTTASKAYAVGEYLTYNGTLYKVTAAISSGGTITVGTNVAQTNVGAELGNIEATITDKVLRFDNLAVSAGTGNIATKNDSAITADHVVVECVWGNPSYITTDVTATTTAGSLVLNGTCTTATTATVTLVKKDN